MNWLIAVPAWGPRCLPAFLEATLPALRLALLRVRGEVRWLVHTDEPSRVRSVLGKSSLDLLPVPGGSPPHGQLGAANRDALNSARIGEVVALVNADMVASIELFEAAERRFAQGKRCIVMTGTRTLSGHRPPIGATSRDLLAWAWNHRHPWIIDTTWGEGKTRTPSLIHFRQGETVVLHGFHLHPFAVLKERELTFPGVTTDQDLIEQFPREQVHVVTSADEASFAEMSPAERSFAHGPNIIDAKSITDWATRPNKTTATHRWLFTHRINLCGEDKDVGDAAVCAEILATIDRWEEPAGPGAMSLVEQRRHERKRQRELRLATRMAQAQRRRRR